MSIRAVNIYKNSSGTKEKRENTEIHFGIIPKLLHEEYLDLYEGIHLEIVNTTRFNEIADLSTTYLGK